MKVLISAYACAPGMGSEPGAGWNWALAAARNHDVTVLTRSDNRTAIERAASSSRVSFEYLDLPSWARSWRRHRAGIRVHYFLWQLFAARRSRRLHRERRFDVVHHITYANIWFPALACATDAPFILGPTSGGQRVPFRLYPVLGVAAIGEVSMRIARAVARFNPLVRLAWSRADLILVNNVETRDALPRRHRSKVEIRTYASVDEELMVVSSSGKSGLTAVCAGRLNRFKGVSLAIRAVAQAPGWKLEVVGSGSDEKRLRSLVDELGLAERVEFTSNLPQHDLWQLVANADVLLLPTLKEGASFIAVEAQALRVPVIALDQGGPATLARLQGAQFYLVEPGTPSHCVARFAQALRDLERAPKPSSWPDVSNEAVARDVDRIYASLAAAES